MEPVQFLTAFTLIAIPIPSSGLTDYLASYPDRAACEQARPWVEAKLDPTKWKIECSPTYEGSYGLEQRVESLSRTAPTKPNEAPRPIHAEK